MPPIGNIGFVIGIVLVVAFILLAIIANRWVKVGPNQVLIVSGRRRIVRGPDGRPTTVGFRLVRGGGSFVMPVLEMAEVMSLELMTLEVRTPEVYTVMGVPVQVDGIAQIKVRNDDVSISTAAEQFLSMGAAQIRQIALQTVEGHLRAILGMMTVEEIYRERDKFAQRVQDVAATDMANMGLQIVSFTIRDIRDTQGYLDALGKPRIAQVKRDATIGEAEANRDAIIRSAQANQEGQQAKYAADTQIAEADRDYKIKLAEYTAAVNKKKAEADLAYDLQKYQTQQLVTAEQVKVQVVEKENLIQVQEKEIQRREKELTATIERPADAERYRIQQLADAEQYRLRTTAQGQADAIRATGVAEADANKARGLAEAEVIRQQGLATAEAMAKKAAAWREYNEAAIAQMFIDRMPEIAAAIAAPLAKTEKIVVVSTGDGAGAGASKVTGDVTAIIAQLPPVVEALTGLKLEELVQKIPGMTGKTPPAAPEG
ncbi:MAG: Inner membrane protein YqiK [bacterium ADurb.Bin429]|nr:MAG: Inner membrane protein YqiK [bacterium ADurb.Bin429]